VNLGSRFNTAALDCCPWISSDGLELYFASGRPGGYGGWDLYVSKRATQNDSWSDAANLGPVVNSAYADPDVCLSPDGLVLFFSGLYDSPVRPGGLGGSDTWMTRRASREGAWQEPVNIGTPVNGSADDCMLRISPDGSTLYFVRYSAGSWENWQAPIVPIVDFNGDGKIDVGDMVAMEDNWGQNDPLCDIGPFPWGDGVVDEKDWAVLMESLMTPGQHATDVSCDVVLSWTGPSFADSYDVYFGTSFDDVSNATRDDPCGVLVSEGQTETTCDPEGLLEFGQTYYWRVDMVEVVVGSLDPAIYRGPVLKFTTELFAYAIQAVMATSSGISDASAGPENTVNGSGLDALDQHSIASSDMWVARPPAEGPLWIQYEFDRVYNLYELWVWNYNVQFELVLGFGLKDVTIEYSENGADWTTLGDFEFARATAKATYTANTTVDFGGVAAKFVRLTINSGYGMMGQYGLSEVRFFHIPDRSFTYQ